MDKHGVMFASFAIELEVNQDDLTVLIVLMLNFKTQDVRVCKPAVKPAVKGFVFGSTALAEQNGDRGDDDSFQGLVSWSPMCQFRRLIGVSLKS